MEKISTKVKKWGNSFGIILPKAVLDKEMLEEGSELTITITNKRAATAQDLIDIGIKRNLKIKGDVGSLIKKIDREMWED